MIKDMNGVFAYRCPYLTKRIAPTIEDDGNMICVWKRPHCINLSLQKASAVRGNCI
jgi:hypothetical protein